MGTSLPPDVSLYISNKKLPNGHLQAPNGGGTVCRHVLLVQFNCSVFDKKVEDLKVKHFGVRIEGEANRANSFVGIGSPSSCLCFTSPVIASAPVSCHPERDSLDLELSLWAACLMPAVDTFQLLPKSIVAAQSIYDQLARWKVTRGLLSVLVSEDVT